MNHNPVSIFWVRFVALVAFSEREHSLIEMFPLLAFSLALLTSIPGIWSASSLFAQNQTKNEWDVRRAISPIKGVATAEDAQEIGDLQAEAAPGSKGCIAAQIKTKQAEIQKLNADAKSLICPGS